MVKKINFVVNPTKLKKMAYGDAVYAWLLLHSHYNPDECHNYIYARDFTFLQIAKDIGRSNKTVSKRFKELLEMPLNGGEKPLIVYDATNKCYLLPCFAEFQKLDSDTILNLFRLSNEKERREELIKTYAWLLKRFLKGEKALSYVELIETFGHSRGNE